MRLDTALRVCGATCLLSGVVLATGCSPGSEGREPSLRLRPAGEAATPTGVPPRAEIGGESREVLVAPASRRVMVRRSVVVPRAGEFGLEVELGAGFAGARRVVFSGRARGPRGWEALAPVVAAVRGTPSRPRAAFVHALAPFAIGARVEVFIDAWRLPDRVSRHRTEVIAVPDAAELEFATGVLAPAASQGPVRFSVSACRQDACRTLFSEAVDAALGWRDWRIDLGALAGETRAFVFEAEPTRGGGDAWSLPVWGHPTLTVPATRVPPGPNLLLVSLDTLRADHVETYGYRRETAPFLARDLARRGTVFERLTAAATTTGPSHMTLFTSLPPSVHGAVRSFGRVATPVVTLAEALQTAGFETAAFTENGPLAERRGFGRGFTRYAENKSPNLMSPQGHVERTFGQGRRWLERFGDRRFFLFLHTFQVHAPFAPPAAYAARLREGERPAPGGATRSARVRGLVDAYDAEIRYVDDVLGELVGWLDRSGLADSTILVVTSDHGEGFLEHGSIGHQALPHEELLHVPLYLAGPGIPEGHRVEEPVAHIDLMPTLLELLGVEVPAHVQGRSFRERLPRSASRAPERPHFSEAWALPDGFEPPALAVRRGARKLIRYRESGREHFVYYDLASDPGETRDLYGERAEEAEELRVLLAEYEREARRLRGELGRGPSSATPAAGSDTQLDPEREEKLRALGYLE